MKQEATLVCDFCWRMCALTEGQYGQCAVRVRQGQNIVSTTYAKVEAIGIDPIEKKPLYHFYPGSRTFSFALHGCNITCSFCQNHILSQGPVSKERTVALLEPAQLLSLAQREGCHSVSYTYSEPLVWQDYMIDVAKLAHEQGMKNIMVTNGLFSSASLERIVPLMDAFNIDIKGNEQFYQEVCRGSQEPVLEAIERIASSAAHLEVTTMLIEDIHTPHDVEILSQNLVDRGVQIWHISRFFPRHAMAHYKPTSEAYLQEMLSLAKNSSIPYIYGGNTQSQRQTLCPSCHALLIRDGGHLVSSFSHGSCPTCSEKIYGVFS